MRSYVFCFHFSLNKFEKKKTLQNCHISFVMYVVVMNDNNTKHLIKIICHFVYAMKKQKRK